jgi:hypothetical protein
MAIKGHFYRSGHETPTLRRIVGFLVVIFSVISVHFLKHRLGENVAKSLT